MRFSDVKLVGFARPVEASRAKDFELLVAIHAPDSHKGQAAIALMACRRAYLRPQLTGAANSFAVGVAADSACGAVVIDVIGMDPEIVSNGGLVRLAGRVAKIPDESQRIVLAPTVLGEEGIP